MINTLLQSLVVLGLASFSLLMPLTVVAQDDGEVTMMVLEEGAAPESTYQVIELPPLAAPQTSRGKNQQDHKAQIRTNEIRNEAVSAAQEAVQDRIGGGAIDKLPEHARENIPTHVLDRLQENDPSVPDEPDLPELPGIPGTQSNEP